MAVNEEDRQRELARELEELARTLAHSTRTVPSPGESYSLVGDLGATTDHLAQVAMQLASWHRRAAGEGLCDGSGVAAAEQASVELERAADALKAGARAVSAAHVANGAVRWRSAG